MIRLIFAFAVITARPLANPDILEPSIQNEVDHALAIVPTRPAETNIAIIAVQREFSHIYATNGMNATERAIALVSAQKNGEWFYHGTNVTEAAVKLLQH